MLEVALEKQYIQKSGDYYYYGRARIATGEVDAIRFLYDNHEVYEELDQLIHKGYVSRLIEEPTTDDNDDDAEIRRLLDIEMMWKETPGNGKGKDNEGFGCYPDR